MTFEQGIFTVFGVLIGVSIVVEGIKQNAAESRRLRQIVREYSPPSSATKPASPAQKSSVGPSEIAAAVVYPRRLRVGEVEYALAAEDWWAVLEALPKLNPGTVLLVKLPGAQWLAGQTPPKELAKVVNLIQDLAALRGVKLTL